MTGAATKVVDIRQPSFYGKLPKKPRNWPIHLPWWRSIIRIYWCSNKRSSAPTRLLLLSHARIRLSPWTMGASLVVLTLLIPQRRVWAFWADARLFQLLLLEHRGEPVSSSCRPAITERESEGWIALLISFMMYSLRESLRAKRANVVLCKLWKRLKCFLSLPFRVNIFSGNDNGMYLTSWDIYLFFLNQS